MTDQPKTPSQSETAAQDETPDVPTASASPRWPVWLRLLLAALSGLLMGSAFRPVGAWPLAFVGFVPMWLAIRRSGPWGTVVLAYIFSIVFLVPTIGWLGALAPDPAYSILALGLILLVWGLHHSIGFVLMRWLWNRGGWWAPMGVVAIWLGVEAARLAHLPLPFPWLYVGSALWPATGLIQIADLGGVFLLSALVVGVNAALATPAMHKLSHGTCSKPKRYGGLAVAAGLLIATWIYGLARIPAIEEASHPGPNVALVQPNKMYRPEQRQEWAEEANALVATRDAAYERLNANATDAAARQAYDEAQAAVRELQDRMQVPAREERQRLYEFALEAMRTEGVDMIVWPEAVEAVPQTAMDQQGHNLRQVLERDYLTMNDGQTPPPLYMLVGWSLQTTDMHELLQRPYKENAAVLLAPDGAVLDYSAKHDLVPAGEYIPFVGLPLVRDIVQAGYGGNLPNHRPGARFTRFYLPAADGSETWSFAVPICYEMAFGPTVRDYVLGTGERGEGGSDAPLPPADMLINLSDDSWYRQSAELDQMLGQAVLRCVEHRRGMARCTQTGISAIISPTGKRLQIAEDENGQRKEIPALLIGHVPICRATSLYTTYGDWILWLALLAGLIALSLALRRQLRG